MIGKTAEGAQAPAVGRVTFPSLILRALLFFPLRNEAKNRPKILLAESGGRARTPFRGGGAVASRDSEPELKHIGL